MSSFQHSLSDFIVEFINEKDFKKLVENMSFPLRAYGHIAMTGYFSEGMAQTIIEIETVRTRACKIQILSPTLGKSPRDKENIKALRKLQDMGVEVRIHSRLHCRMIIAYSNTPKITGVLVLGSFDPNNEGMTATQRNAGIKTMHPYLVASAVKYFDEIWKEPRDSLPLNDVYPE